MSSACEFSGNESDEVIEISEDSSEDSSDVSGDDSVVELSSESESESEENSDSDSAECGNVNKFSSTISRSFNILICSCYFNACS